MAANRLSLDKRLVLNQWMLDLFEASSLSDIVTPDMKRSECEELDENNVSLFYHELTLSLVDHPSLTNDELLRYDNNIVGHTQRINAHRRKPIRWKYFQYLSLLFAEIYLDRYFRDPEGLLTELNEHVARFNAGDLAVGEGQIIGPPPSKRDQVEPYEEDDLRKIAFWMATGSGKTLLMHINILQFLHYLRMHGQERELNRIILLTPNEGLSRQHLEELQQSGIDAEIFSKDVQASFNRGAVEIIDIHKLRDEMGDKTVAVDAFEDNNLVLVDEGHRGAGGVEWMDKRDRLCEDGFSFEYSATFGQAIRASGKRELEQTYAKCILFDYSYRHFYLDGYGKDYRILNLADDSDPETRRLYLTACLLSFYQQQHLYREREQELRPFLLEPPLWVFVGRTVTSGTSQADKRTMTDVVAVLDFLSEFVEDRQVSVSMLDRLVGGAPGLLDEQGRDIFAEAFAYLIGERLSGTELFQEILSTLFNAPGGGLLHVDNLTGVDGEVILRLGDNEPFGLINVGEDRKLCTLCEEHGDEFIVGDLEFSDSLFDEINTGDSTINVLIGAKKFTEGWNSWRVSTMGLMNIGRTEGSEIIQLFGRGVRLRGHEHSLKRSTEIPGLEAPKHISVVETLNVFGIRADYMRQFKDYLEAEGIPTEERREIILPVIKNLDGRPLKTISVAEDQDFQADGPKPKLEASATDALRSPVVVNWYPKVQARTSAGLQGDGQERELNRGYLRKQHIAFLDTRSLYSDLQEYKAQRGWHNLEIPRETIPELLLRDDWYCLYIPPEELELESFRRVDRWQEIAATLLRKYCERCYNHERSAWESEHLEVHELCEEDSNFPERHRILLDESMDALISKLEEVQEAIAGGVLADIEWGHIFHAIIDFDRHLYYPLLHIKHDDVQVTPVALNDGERDFVCNLRDFYRDTPEFFDGNELYLLRNQSRGRGVGFFEANNFHPDFILWLVRGDHQSVLFVDPKGLRNLDGLDDPKVELRETIKEIEERIGDPTLTLNSCLIAVTAPDDVPFWGRHREQMEEHHVFFQDDENHIRKMLTVAEQGLEEMV